MHVVSPEDKNIECILFDLDGVMVHPWGFAKLLDKNYGITKELTKEFFTNVFPQCARGKLDLKQALIPFLEKWSWQKSVDKFVDEWLESENLPNTKMTALVKELRESGYLVCLASNQEKYRARYIEKEMGFGYLFDHLFISCDLGAMKPEPKFYDLIESKLNKSAKTFLFIDDQKPYVDAAIKQGWNAIKYSDYQSLFGSKNQMIRFTSKTID